MKKLVLAGLFALSFVFFIHAGDAAVFVNKGFSEDGNFFVFAQYGKVDKTFQAWAELYTVDIKQNDYVDGGVFKILPTKETSRKKAGAVYAELLSKNSNYIEKLNLSAAKADQILYIREDEKKSSTDEIVFKDFTYSIGAEQAKYKIKLVPTYEGEGVNTKSSFFITVEKQDEDGNIVARQNVGSPSIKRRGVVAYKIERIECDASGRKIVFVIEKQVRDKTGLNIRYMVEAAVLSGDFSIPPKKDSDSNSTSADGKTSPQIIKAQEFIDG